MALKADDLQRGMLVAIIGRREQDDPNPFALFGNYRQAPKFTGIPLQILEVSLPFVAVTDGETVGSLDVREVDLGRVSRRYWKLLQDMRTTSGKSRTAPKVKQRQKKERLGPGYCPHCRDKLAQRWMPDRRWYFWCRNCQELGGPADSA